MRVVVIVKDGVVRQVLADDARVQVLVLDDSTSGCDEDAKLEVVGDEVALDAMAQGLATVDKTEVQKLYDGVKDKLRACAESSYAASVQAALFG